MGTAPAPTPSKFDPSKFNTKLSEIAMMILEASRNSTNFSILPRLVVIRIFSFLPLESILTCARANKRFHKLITCSLKMQPYIYMEPLNPSPSATPSAVFLHPVFGHLNFSASHNRRVIRVGKCSSEIYLVASPVRTQSATSPTLGKVVFKILSGKEWPFNAQVTVTNHTGVTVLDVIEGLTSFFKQYQQISFASHFGKKVCAKYGFDPSAMMQNHEFLNPSSPFPKIYIPDRERRGLFIADYAFNEFAAKPLVLRPLKWCLEHKEKADLAKAQVQALDDKVEAWNDKVTRSLEDKKQADLVKTQLQVLDGGIEVTNEGITRSSADKQQAGLDKPELQALDKKVEAKHVEVGQRLEGKKKTDLAKTEQLQALQAKIKAWNDEVNRSLEEKEKADLAKIGLQALDDKVGAWSDGVQRSLEEKKLAGLVKPQLQPLVEKLEVTDKQEAVINDGVNQNFEEKQPVDLDQSELEVLDEKVEATNDEVNRNLHDKEQVDLVKSEPEVSYEEEKATNDESNQGLNEQEKADLVEPELAPVDEKFDATNDELDHNVEEKKQVDLVKSELEVSNGEEQATNNEVNLGLDEQEKAGLAKSEPEVMDKKAEAPNDDVNQGEVNEDQSAGREPTDSKAVCTNTVMAMEVNETSKNQEESKLDTDTNSVMSPQKVNAGGSQSTRISSAGSGRSSSTGTNILLPRPEPIVVTAVTAKEADNDTVNRETLEMKHELEPKVDVSTPSKGPLEDYTTLAEKPVEVALNRDMPMTSELSSAELPFPVITEAPPIIPEEAPEIPMLEEAHTAIPLKFTTKTSMKFKSARKIKKTGSKTPATTEWDDVFD